MPWRSTPRAYETTIESIGGTQHRRHQRHYSTAPDALSSRSSPLWSRLCWPMILCPSRILIVHPPIVPYCHVVVRIPPLCIEATNGERTTSTETETWATAVDHHSGPYLSADARHEDYEMVEIVHAPLIWSSIGCFFYRVNHRLWSRWQQRQKISCFLLRVIVSHDDTTA